MRAPLPEPVRPSRVRAGGRPQLPRAAAALMLALLLASGCGSSTTHKRLAFAGSTLEPPQPAPSLGALRNYDGTAFDIAAQHGKAVFVTFLYAHCPDVCPLIASNLHVAFTKMSPSMQRKVAIVAVSADPRGDSAGVVAEFVA